MESQINNNAKYLYKLHQDILTIMDEVDRICSENKLRYYLMCGSCLGAVRHNGFIPWDDDLDIAMPRGDFNRLLELISNKKILGDSFYLRWVTTEKYYNHAFAKICLKGTKFQESEGPSALNAGVFVDIFPLDTCEYNIKKIEKKNRLFVSLSQFIRYKGAGHKKHNQKGLLKKIVTTIFSNTIIHKIMLFVIGASDECKSQYQIFWGTPYPINRMIFPKEWHGVGKRMLFEGRYYVCPSEAELYLEHIYGKSWMQIPPENKRKTHYPIRVVFSDGEEMLFDKPESKIKHTDLLS